MVRICLLRLLALAIAVPFSGVAGSGDSFGTALEERMPGLLQRYGVPGAVVSCIKTGEVAWAKAFGLANLETGARMQPDMVF